MDENEMYEAMGLEPPVSEGERSDPAGAAQAGSDPQGGEHASATPDTPAVLTGEADAAEESHLTEEEAAGEAKPGTPQPMSDEERHRQAAIRREAERAEHQKAQQAAVDQAYAAAFAGRLNPYTKRPITTKAEFDEYQAQLREDQQRQQVERMRAAGVDPAAIQGMIDNHPVVQQAQQVIAQAQAEREKAQATQAKGWYGGQLQQINALDPEAKVTSLDELAAREPEQYTKMLGMVGRGVSLVDAYKMVHFDELTQKRARAAQQAVRNQVAGKGHLIPTGAQGKAGVDVPASVREMYQDMGLEMSDAEIARSYGEYIRSAEHL